MISAGSGWKPTLRGTRVPTEIEKLTLVTGWTCWLRITVVILVRCSPESFAPAPAWPVVVEVPARLRSSALFMLLLLRSSARFVLLLLLLRSSARLVLLLRSSAFMSLAGADFWLSELMRLDFWPCILLSWARWFLLPSLSLDCADFGASAGAPLWDESRFDAPEEGFCWVVALGGDSRPVPLP